MIDKHYTLSCDECAERVPLRGQSIKDCSSEAQNLGWVPAKDKSKQWYCPACTRMMDQKANASQSS